MSGYLILFSVIILICIILNRISSRFGIPVLLAFICLGMLFGEDGLFKIHFENFDFAAQFCTIALIFIMFYGGFGTKWSEAKKVSKISILLASLGVVMTAFFVGLFCTYVLGIAPLESFLIGSIISSTDAATVFSILRTNKLHLKYSTASILEVESGSNDPAAYMLTIIMLGVMKSGIQANDLILLIFKQVFFGLLFAYILSFLSIRILKKIVVIADGFDTVFVFIIALLAYSLSDYLGGNGYLTTYIVGMALGNACIRHKKNLVSFFDGITGLMEMCIFFLLGLLSTPSKFMDVIGISIVIVLFLTFVARTVAVFLIMTPFKAPIKQQLFVSWSGLRGAASIVFSILAVTGGIHFEHDIFHIVFIIVLISLSVQGGLIPKVSKLLDMYDKDGNIMKTFNDYGGDSLQFIKLDITENHAWANKKLYELVLPHDFLIVLIIKNGISHIPKGNTVINPKDMLVISAPAYQDNIPINISETLLSSKDEYVGKALSEITFSKNELVTMVKRGEHYIIPSGATILQENDIVIKVET